MSPVAYLLIAIIAIVASLIVAVLIGQIIKGGRETEETINELDDMRRGEARFSDPRSCRDV